MCHSIAIYYSENKFLSLFKPSVWLTFLMLQLRTILLGFLWQYCFAEGCTREVSYADADTKRMLSNSLPLPLQIPSSVFLEKQHVSLCSERHLFLIVWFFYVMSNCPKMSLYSDDTNKQMCRVFPNLLSK